MNWRPHFSNCGAYLNKMAVNGYTTHIVVPVILWFFHVAVRALPILEHPPVPEEIRPRYCPDYPITQQLMKKNLLKNAKKKKKKTSMV